MIKAIIIDDEPKSRISIKGMLDLYCPNVEVIAEAECVETGIEAIRAHHPQVVFLDIKLAGKTGFDILEKLEKDKDKELLKPFKVIFISAYDSFGIKAIKFSALDYLLKPIDPKELVKAIRKVESKTHFEENTNQTLSVLLENFEHSPEVNNKRIVIPTSTGMHVYKIKDIVRCQSDSSYTKFFFDTGKTLLTSKTLKEFDELLSDYRFERVHKSHLINMAYVERYVLSDGGYLIMHDGAKLPVANRKKQYVLNLLKEL